MAGRGYKTEAVVLRSLRFGEADRVLHLYTLERGRVGAVAKGIRRTKSRFGARLEPLSHAEVMLHQGSGELATVTGASLVRPTQGGRHGHPILIAQPVIRELLAADPSAPARSIIRRHAAHGIELEVADHGPFLDVDTPEEYRQLITSLTVDR